jgi:general stress protein 26
MTQTAPENLLSRFWRELCELRTGMLGLASEDDAHAQPMTAQFDGKEGPLYFFAHMHSPLTQACDQGRPAVFHYAGPRHELYACVHGELALHDDRAVIERFWCADVARWYPAGQHDPDLALLCFTPSSARIWLASEGPAPALFGFGRDRETPRDIHADVRL